MKPSTALTPEAPHGIGEPRIEIPNGPAAARWARQWPAGPLRVAHPPLVDDVLLCLSEAVTNVHRHTDTPQVRIDTLITNGCVRIHVHDNRPTPLPVAAGRAHGRQEHGRGLTLIDACADAWGVTYLGGGRRGPTGKAVWFTLLGQCAGAGGDRGGSRPPGT
ncbi:ATP-binding protein [Streptomyces sp. CAU 1734]|uniref:ATP-binding protein n=1 Tax=Streptomyces sp. CAU 1734 TaxID=3140360 RepID=UPI003261C1D5